MSDDLVNRLNGIYRIKITDGLGPAGGEEPNNPDEFVRTYETPPIQKEAAARIAALEAENKRLRDFANIAIDVAFDGGDLDGGEIQDMAASCGLIETAKATEENRDMWEHIDYMDVGDDFYVKSAILRRAKAALEV